MLTTVGDLLRWNRNFTTARVGGPAFVEQQLIRGKLTNGRTIHYAAGLMLLHYKGLDEVSHSGTTAAYNAWLARYPGQDLSVAVLCNTSAASGPQLGHAVADVFLNGAAQTPVPAHGVVDAQQAGLYRSTRDHSVITLAEGADAARYRFEPDNGLRMVSEQDEIVYEKVERWTPPAAELAEFVGAYTSDEAEVTLRVAADHEGLALLRRPDTRIALAPLYRDGFNAPGLGSVRFLRDGAGKVTALSVGQARVWDLRFERQ